MLKKLLLVLAGVYLGSSTIAAPVSNCTPYRITIKKCKGAIAGTTLPQSEIKIKAGATGNIPTNPLLTGLRCKLSIKRSHHAHTTSKFFFYWYNYTIPDIRQQPNNAVMVATLPIHLWICRPGTPASQCVGMC